jgi:hypothetical protein
MHLTKQCSNIPSKGLDKEGSNITAKYPPKRRKGWFSRVACRARNLPFYVVHTLLVIQREDELWIW